MGREERAWDKDWRYDDDLPFSRERQRLSTTDWFSLLPGTIAEKQCAYERRHETLRRYETSGLTMSWIGKMYGISGNQVRQLIQRAKRDKKYDLKSPAEKYFEAIDAPDQNDIIWKTGSKLFRKRYPFGKVHKLSIIANVIQKANGIYPKEEI